MPMLYPRRMYSLSGRASHIRQEVYEPLSLKDQMRNANTQIYSFKGKSSHNICALNITRGVIRL